jgi:hypothetical protein
LTKPGSVVGRSMQKGRRHHLIIGKTLGMRFFGRSNGRSNMAILQDIWTMTVISVVGGQRHMGGRCPSSTWKSSTIAALSELGVCVVEVNWRHVW